MTTPLLELRHITIRRNGQTLLEDVNLALDRGRHGLIGPNGAGKTSLLHVCVGLLGPAGGEVRFKGRRVESEEDWRSLRRGVGFLFQDPDDQLFSPTVIEDVAFGLLNQGAPPDQARTRSEAMLERLGLAGFGDRLIHRLSGGEKKLVSLATILVMEPELLLLDEPSNALDHPTRERLAGIIRSLPQPCLIVSHDYDFLARTTDTLHGLDQGRLIPCQNDLLHVHRHAHPFGDRPHRHGD